MGGGEFRDNSTLEALSYKVLQDFPQPIKEYTNVSPWKQHKLHLVNDVAARRYNQEVYLAGRSSTWPIQGLYLPTGTRTKTRKNENFTWPPHGHHLAITLRGLGPQYALPRPRLRQHGEDDHIFPGRPQRLLYNSKILAKEPEKEMRTCQRASSGQSTLPTCSCCLSTIRANSITDPSSPWAFTIVNTVKKKKRWNRNWCLVLILSSCLLIVVMGLLYLCQTTHVMQQGVTEY